MSAKKSYENRSMVMVKAFVAAMKRRGYTREQVTDMIDSADVEQGKEKTHEGR